MKIGNLVRFVYNSKPRVGRVEEITEKFIRVFVGNGEFRTFKLDKIVGLVIIGGE